MSNPEPDEAGASPLFPAQALEQAVQMLRLLGWLAALGAVVTAVALLMPTLTVHGNPWPPALVLLACAGGACAALLFAIAAALRRGRAGARAAAIGCACVVLVGFPIGTAIGGYLLWLLLFRWQTEPAPPATDPDPDRNPAR